ncbi:MAG TPA: hypothetical protein VIL46_09710, partial [Gemmataceae bacterium]
MVLALIFVLTTVGLTALFWGGSLLAQGYLYNLPASRLELRAVAAGTAMGLFLTGWVWLDQKNPGRYDTLFDFSQYDIKRFDRFEAVKKNRAGVEKTVVYERRGGGRRGSDYLDPQGRPFVKNDADSMVVAIVVEEDGRPVRFNATLDAQGRFVPSEEFYKEEGGDRYMTETGVGQVLDPRLGVLFANLLLNLVHFLLWFVLLWLVLRFQWAHALGLAFVLW